MITESLIKALGGRFLKQYIQTDTYPATLSEVCTGLTFINTDTSNAATLTITKQTGGDVVVIVPKASTYTELFQPFSIIKSVAGATTYLITVRN